MTVDECGVPRQPLDDLIQANRQDQLVTRYETYDELKQYCELSANPVGQVVLAIMGAATPARITASDSICTALQIVEHTQDVAEDLRQRQDLPAARGPRALRRHRGSTWPGRARTQTSAADQVRGGPGGTTA